MKGKKKSTDLVFSQQQRTQISNACKRVQNAININNSTLAERRQPMTPPKKIYLGQNPTTGEPYDDWQKTRCESSDVAYYSEEHIRAIENELYNNGDAFIAKLNGKSFSEYLKED